MVAHILPCIIELELLSLAAFALQHVRELAWLLASRVRR